MIILKEFPKQPNHLQEDIFHTNAFFQLHKNENCHFFSFYKDEKLVATIHVCEIEKGVFQSPFRGTYGSFAFEQDADYQTIQEVISAFVAKLKNQYFAQKIILKNAPIAHNQHQNTLIFNILYNLKFSITLQEVNHTLNIDDVPLFEKMKRNNKKRFKKCEREGMIFEQVYEESQARKVYDVIVENRMSKGYFVSMSFEQIMQMKAIFPNDIYFFQTRLDNEISASSICIRLNSNILYIFYWGDKPGFEQYSPVVFLAEGIYRFAQHHHFNLLDAGTSSLNGILNAGVANFKEGLGFIASSKLVFTYE